jgi:hypothetical protein
MIDGAVFLDDHVVTALVIFGDFGTHLSVVDVLFYLRRLCEYILDCQEDLLDRDDVLEG